MPEKISPDGDPGGGTPSAPGAYGRQHRGGTEAYESYFAGMDASVRQKVALTTAHFPGRGRVADMGSGSGRGTYDLACLYHGLELVGVDINPVSVGMAGGQYRRTNLGDDFGVRVRRAWELGGAYFATPGVTPEAVYPYAAEVDLPTSAGGGLRFVRLDALIDGLETVRDAHLIVAACRLAHALAVG